MAQKIRLTESQLHKLVSESLQEMVNDGEIDESWLGNVFKGVGKTVGDQVSKGYNKMAMNINNAQASDASAQADAMDKEVEELDASIKPQVKKYRGELMSELNKKVREFEMKLKQDLASKQEKAGAMRTKANGYADKAASNRDRYQQLHDEPLQGQNASAMGRVDESTINRIIRQSIKKVVK